MVVSLVKAERTTAVPRGRPILLGQAPSKAVAVTIGGVVDLLGSRIAEAALATLKAHGFAGASARAIAHVGGFNQALIFYHFGSVQNALLGAEMAARIEPWIAMVERKLEELLAASPVRTLVSSADLAFGIVSLYFGVDMLSHLQRDRARAESLLDLATRLAVLLETFLPPIAEESS
jgi:AcrR family transcriptional regulator